MSLFDKFRKWKRKQRWNRQYKKGRWDNLKNETQRYDTIAEFVTKYSNANPNILALGCGEGILLHHINETKYNSFLGMDFSSVSIDNAKKLGYKKATFVCEDIHTFIPKQDYDVIIFNEAFYYIDEHKKAEILDRMIQNLNTNGIIITSIFREGKSCWPYFETEKLKTETFVTVTTENPDKYWKIGVYRTA